ncbi:hypothetical protein AAFC00_000389 [Neodothiora populina]
MASICGVCQLQPSKYKCSKCELPYCSLACYKSHKDSHAEEVVEPQESAESPVSTPVQEDVPVSSAARGRQSKKIDYSDLQNDPDLLRLMNRYPGLRIQLQHIYSFTLEPDPEEQRFSSFQGRGRGRGRGGRGRGGWRGRGGFNQQQSRPSQWTQSKGDKEAADAFKRMRTSEGEEEGLAEFVQLIAMKYGKPVGNDDTT